MIEGGTDQAWRVAPGPSLSDIVANRVVEAIRLGQLRPGERIIEVSLAKKLGVSRGPLREALKSLHAAHIVVGHKNQGMRVAKISAEQSVSMLLLRGTLEGLAARLIAARRTPELLQPLVDLHSRSIAAANQDRSAEWRELDWQFHEAVCRSSGNDYLLSAWQEISNLVRLFLHDHLGFERHSETVLRNHAGLIDALLVATPDEADARFRGSIIGSGFSRLGLAVPPHLEDVVKHGRLTQTAGAAPRRSRAKGVSA